MTLNSKLFLLWKSSWGFILMQPVMVLYFQHKGLDYQEMFVVQSLFGLTLALSEIPTSIMSDLIGRKVMMIVGCLFRGLGATMLWYGDGFSWMTCAYIAIGLGNSSISGTDIAYFYESSRKLEAKGFNSAKVMGDFQTAFLVGGMLTAVIGGYVGEYSLAAVGFWNMVFAWVVLPLALLLKNDTNGSVHQEGDEIPPSRGVVHNTGVQLISTLRAIAGDLSLLNALLHKANTIFLASFGYFVFQYKWKQFDLPLTEFGWILAVGMLLGAVGAQITRRSIKGTNWLKSPTVAFTGIVLSLILVAQDTMLVAIAGAVSFSFFLTIAIVMLGISVQDQLEDEYRATAESLSSLIGFGVLYFLSPIIGGQLNNHQTYVVFALGIGMALISMCLVQLPFRSGRSHQHGGEE